MNVSQKLIRGHMREGTTQPVEEIALAVDQTLTQDATGTISNKRKFSIKGHT